MPQIENLERTDKTNVKSDEDGQEKSAIRQHKNDRIPNERPYAPWQFMQRCCQSIWPQTRQLWQRTRALLYAAYLYLVLFILSPVAWTAVVLAPNLTRSYGAARWFARLFFRLGRIPIRIQGLEHLEQQKHCIVVSNHCSYADGPILTAALPVPLSYVAKRELTRNLISRLFLKRLHTEFVERFNRHKGTTDARQVIKAAKQGRSFIFFPEGTFYRRHGLQAFRMGAFLTAVRAGVPVVPVSIRGSRSLLLEDTWFPRRTEITVTVCPPLAPEGKERAAAAKLRNAARAEVLKHCGEPDLTG